MKKSGVVTFVLFVALALWLVAEDRGMLPPDPFAGVDAALMEMGEGW